MCKQVTRNYSNLPVGPPGSPPEFTMVPGASVFKTEADMVKKDENYVDLAFYNFGIFIKKIETREESSRYALFC